MWYNSCTMRTSHEQVFRRVADVEQALEFSMRQHPFADAINPEGMRLKGSVCGFACQALSIWLENQGIRNQLTIGQPFKDESIVPVEMRQHVVIETEGAVIDPTYGQFMKLIAPEKSKLPRHMYPKSSIAYIPKGWELLVGESYANFALAKRRDLRDICRPEVSGTAMEYDKLRQPSDEQLEEAFTGLWGADYKPFDPEGDSGVFVERAVKDIYSYTEGRTEG